MHTDRLRALLHALRAGAVEPEQVLTALQASVELRAEDLQYATVDTARALRTGVPEVVFGQGKTAAQVLGIVQQLHAAGQSAVVTRLDAPKAEVLLPELPGAVYHAVARVLELRARPWQDLGRGEVAVICAGTSDLPVAEEAAVVAHALGNRVRRVSDVGVAGLHRILRHLALLNEARVLIVVAGMEGALPSVIAGLSDRPVIAVPTSVGYGASFGGLAALLAMLNSCAAGVSVVNIDNGFGAAYQASLINRLP